jgi:hypothetical protein
MLRKAILATLTKGIRMCLVVLTDSFIWEFFFSLCILSPYTTASPSSMTWHSIISYHYRRSCLDIHRIYLYLTPAGTATMKYLRSFLYPPFLLVSRTRPVCFCCIWDVCTLSRRKFILRSPCLFDLCRSSLFSILFGPGLRARWSSVSVQNTKKGEDADCLRRKTKSDSRFNWRHRFCRHLIFVSLRLELVVGSTQLLYRQRS